MTKLSTARMIGAVSGFFVSCFALAWMMSLRSGPRELAPRIGFLSALICILGSLAFCWAASAAYFARKWEWSPRTCIRSGWPLAMFGAAILFTSDRFWRLAGMIVPLAMFAGYICRRLVYPDVTDEQASAPEPPVSLFQK